MLRSAWACRRCSEQFRPSSRPTALKWGFLSRNVQGLRSKSNASASTVIYNLVPDDLRRLHLHIEPLLRDAAGRYKLLYDLSQRSELQLDQAAELRKLEPIARSLRNADDIRDEICVVQELATADSENREMMELVKEETTMLDSRLHKSIAQLVEQYLDHSCRSTDDDGSSECESSGGRQSCILEIRAGAGGKEAALFVSDLLNMYFKFSIRKNWRHRIISLSENSLGGCREVIVRIEGHDVYSKLRNEAGVHRVQRVPETESAGRLHTSTASIAVLRDDFDTTKKVELREGDIRVDLYRASGPGGQHVNKTESAVRLTHIPTGLTAQCQDDRSQHRNRAIALEALKARLAAKQAAETIAAQVAERSAQIGTSIGERSDRIRTYNFPQRRVTDHRITTDPIIASMLPSTTNAEIEKNAPLDGVLQGSSDLDKLIDGVQYQNQLRRLLTVINLASRSAASRR